MPAPTGRPGLSVRGEVCRRPRASPTRNGAEPITVPGSLSCKSPESEPGTVTARRGAVTAALVRMAYASRSAHCAANRSHDMNVLYTAQATATGGRAGKVESSDGVVKFDLSMPKALGGTETPGTSNPEQLFAAGYAACFAGAVGLVARNAKVDVKGGVEVKIGRAH